MVKRSKKRVGRKNDQTDVTVLREKVIPLNAIFSPSRVPVAKIEIFSTRKLYILSLDKKVKVRLMLDGSSAVLMIRMTIDL